MAVRPIVITGEPVLHRPAARVEAFDDELATLVADLYETMDAAHGVGLAAPQVGVGVRVVRRPFAHDAAQHARHRAGGQGVEGGSRQARHAPEYRDGPRQERRVSLSAI